MVLRPLYIYKKRCREYVTDYRYYVRCYLITYYHAFYYRMSHYLFLLPIHYLLLTKWQC